MFEIRHRPVPKCTLPINVGTTPYGNYSIYAGDGSNSNGNCTPGGVITVLDNCWVQCPDLLSGSTCMPSTTHPIDTASTEMKPIAFSAAAFFSKQRRGLDSIDTAAITSLFHPHSQPACVPMLVPGRVDAGSEGDYCDGPGNHTAMLEWYVLHMFIDTDTRVALLQPNSLVRRKITVIFPSGSGVVVGIVRLTS
jgi:hypothetical protein